jgi:thiol-disulfide isomerase/thioredoxin
MAGDGEDEPATVMRSGLRPRLAPDDVDDVAAQALEQTSPGVREVERLRNERVGERREVDTDGQVRTRGARVGRKLLLRGLPVAVLLGISVWSWIELSGLDRPTRGPKKQTETIAAPALPDAHAGPKAEAQAEAPEPELPPLGKKVGKLLEGVDLVRVRPPETTETIKMTAAVALDGITVVNLWATWCKPCKRELPGMRAMFAANAGRWADKVRFVPIRIDDTKDEVWSYKGFIGSMPPTDHFLIDAGFDGGVRAALVAAGLIEEKAGLPITLVLDCKQSVRWQHTGELKAPEFAELTGKIDEILAGRERYCRRPRAVRPEPIEEAKPTTTGDLPPVKRCGDGRCEGLENCNSCKKDCSCGAGEACKKTDDGGYFCKESV